jgi:xanthine dehydrogenase accessory factor
MAVRPDGSITGTIGGGSCEAKAIREALRLIGTGQYTVLSEDLTAGPEDIEGMVCGGRMKILIEDWI